MRPIFFIIMLGMLSMGIHAQPLFDNSYSLSANITKLETSGYKYYTMDVPNKQCKVFNLDHSLYKTFNLSVPESYDLYDIQYVSENLFNTDDLVEIVYISYKYNETETGWWYYTYETSIVNENGIEIMNIPGAGLTEVRDLGEDGKKFLVWVYDYSVYPYIIHTNVYDLPEQEPQTTKSASITKDYALLGNPYPNPSSGNFSVPVNLSNSPGHLNMHNMQGGFVKEIKITGQEKNILIPADDLAPGTYLINLRTIDKISKAKTIIIN